MDYLVELLVLDDAGIRPPIIAAGINLFGGPLGLIHRHVTGALPIRRNTKDPAYHITLKAYVAELLRAQDFFFYPEGGRSYSGELKSPKTGLITACLQAAQPNLVIIPVAIAYDLVLEDHVLARQQVKKRQRAFSREVAEMVRYAVGYRSRAYRHLRRADCRRRLQPGVAHVGAGAGPPDDGPHRPADEGAADGADGRRHAAVDPDAELDRPYHRHDRPSARHRRESRRGLGCRSVIARPPSRSRRAASSPATSGRFRVRDRTVLRYYARSIEHLLPAAPAGTLMFAAASKALFHGLAGLRPLQQLASRYGMAPGDRLRAALHRRRDGRARRSRQPARWPPAASACRSTISARASRRWSWPTAATRDYLRIIEQVVASGVERNLSLKLTQLGLDVDRATATDNLRRILEASSPHGFFVRIDMENSPYTDGDAGRARDGVGAGLSRHRHGASSRV